jgi:hypothetical protein
MPDLRGSYFYGDYCGGFVRSFRLQGQAVTDERDWTASAGIQLEQISSFGEDAASELLVVDYEAGVVYRLVPVP